MWLWSQMAELTDGYYFLNKLNTQSLTKLSAIPHYRPDITTAQLLLQIACEFTPSVKNLYTF